MYISQEQEQHQDDQVVSNALIDLSALEKYLSLRRVLIFMAITLFLVAWNRGIALLYAMDALIIAILIVGWLIPKLNIQNISIDISMPETANEGDDIPIYVLTQKTGFFNRYMIELWGDFPFAPPFQMSEKNSGMTLLHKISDQSSHVMQVPCELRGRYTLDSFKLTTGFPLGLATASREVALDKTKVTSSILIYPSPLVIKKFEIANDPSHSAMQLDRNPKVGGHDDYVGVREYRHGDNPRHIHWPSSAKRGEFVVREFQQNSTLHLSIILDLNQHAALGTGKNSTLEYAIKITASLIKYAIDKHYSFSIFGMAKEPIEITADSRSQSPEVLNNALEALAWLKADGEYSYAQTIQSYLAKSRRGGTVVLFDNNGQTAELVSELNAQRYFPVIYQFKTDSFKSINPLPTVPRKVETNNAVIWQLSNGCDLQQLFV